ncbi:MAG: RsmB/NOP family class I SAM-dependent RNA methyltransferase [Spartobacteria bacterium]|nr:RsmB/NOP family class I SAM-dependent RNA methyltransferase [Spartobacteria bacterium]
MNNVSPAHPARAARQAEILLQIIEQTETARRRQEAVDNTLSDLFRKNKRFGSRDRRFYSNAVFAWYRWYGWTRPLRADHPAEAMILSWLLSHEEIPDPILHLMEVSPLNTSSWRPLCHEPLVKRATCLTSWARLGSTPAVADLAPAWLAADLAVPADHVPEAFTERFIEALLERPPTWLSAPPALRENLRTTLEATHLAHSIHPHLDTAFYLDAPFTLPDLCKAIGVGLIIQDLASQCVGMVCAPQPGQSWWDTCAGAGGKSIHLAQLMHNEGTILATDVRGKSLRQIHRRAQDARVSILQVKQQDALEPADKNQVFDGILIDAPCSGIGTWGRNPDMRWRTSADNPAQKADIQRQLLEGVSGQVKNGGTLVYAVCTNTRSETEGVITPFLAAHPDITLDPVPHPLTGVPTDGRIWIWPWDGPCNGMFIARLKKR